MFPRCVHHVDRLDTAAHGLIAAVQRHPPLCAVCRRIVDYVEVGEDFLSAKLRFVVRCHGAEETVEVDIAVIEAGAFTGFGEAFAQKEPPTRLALPPPRARDTG